MIKTCEQRYDQLVGRGDDPDYICTEVLLKDEIAELRAELERLKNQEPVLFIDSGSLEYIKAGGLRIEAIAPRRDVAEDRMFTPLYRAAGASKPPRLLFPTVLRKMWSGSEVQAWLDEQAGASK